MIVLDTTILVYAVGAEHALRDPCRDLLSAVVEGLGATTTPEVIQEFCHVRARRHGRSEAVQLAERYANLLAPLATCSEAELIDGLAIFASNEQLGMFDSVLVAVTKASGARLASADRAFGAVPGLTWLNPADPAFIKRAHG